MKKPSISPTEDEITLARHLEEFLESWNSRQDDSSSIFSSFLQEDANGFGTGSHEIFQSRKDFVDTSNQEKEEMPHSPQILMLWIKTKIIDNLGLTWALFDIKLPESYHGLVLKNVRVSVIWQRTENGWKVIHNHGSLPFTPQKEGEAFPMEELKARNLELEKLVEKQTKELKQEKERTESLLHNILPVKIAQELMETGKAKPAKFEEVSILFSDFKEFTNIVSTIPTKKLIQELNDIFSEFDEIMDLEGIEKIQTIGDAYIAASGLPKEVPDHAERCVRAGKLMIEFLKKRNQTSAIKWKIRIGIHSGPIAAGVVGKKKFTYDIFGDTINIASRIETAGEEGRINVSAYTYDLIKDKYPCVYRGKINAKGKGDLDMYFVN